MNPPVERQFRLEVGVLAVPVGEVVLGQGFGEELDELRLELRPRPTGAVPRSPRSEPTGSRYESRAVSTS